MLNTPTKIAPRKTFKAISITVFLTVVGYYLYGFFFITNTTPVKREAPPLKVDVISIAPQKIRSWNNFTGHLSAVETVSIKPLISGTIQKVMFTEGQHVKKGQPLFVIDPRPLQAALQQAQGLLSVNQSRAKLAQDTQLRGQKLFASNLISRSEYEQLTSADQVAQAEVKRAEAEFNQAELNLNYAYISAPINGRVGRAELTEGNIVEAGTSAPTLTRVVADDKFYAEFNIDEVNYIQLISTIKDPKAMPVELRLADTGKQPYRGYITAFDNQLDSGSGTIRTRAIFENVDGILTAGMFANIRLGSSSESEALLLSDLAIGSDQNKKFVMIVTAQNVALRREVTLGDYYEGQRIILSGLSEGEKVIVNGQTRVRSNSKVIINDSKVLRTNKLASNP